ncbi:hypothetical protein ACPCSP_33995 [Streptomyces cinereoruber]|uniref:hypothetical protein n=1 Tax=Streptomyces cinereoruber TaxID=67260 RepID=UPI003C2B697D
MPGIKRHKAATVGALMVSALALSAAPASAAPNWQSWSVPSDYKCGPTTPHKYSVNIKMQTCIIRNPSNNTYQGVAVVVNNAPTTVYLEAVVFQKRGTTPLRNDTCTNKPIPANTRVACYGGTIANSNPVADSYIVLNSNWGWFTEEVPYN